jgi:hypothetical protein
VADTFKRFRVRAMHKQYGDPGPDLLRPKDLAVKQFGQVMGTARDGWHVRTRGSGNDAEWRNWQGPLGRAEVLRRIETWQRKAGPNAKLQAGRKAKGKVEAKAETQAEVIRHVNLSGVNSGAELVADVIRHQFKADVGGFSCREYNGVPGSGWSDHAWGDAVDLDLNGGSPGPNDKLTDYCVRSAKEGCLGNAAQFIGSKGGKVGSFYAPQYAWNAGGPVSHLTHVHCSYTQHYGRDPNCR